MIASVEAKYINLYLAELYEKALKAYKQGTDNLASSRNKAVWKALAIAYVQEYNLAVRTLGSFGSSALATGGVPIVPPLLDRAMLLSLETLGVEEIDVIVDEAFKDSKRERNIQAQRKRKEVVEYIIQNPSIAADAARAFELVESVAKGQRINFGYAPKEAQRKGGLVKQLIYQRNMSLEAAREEAEKIIAGEAVEKHKPSLTKEELDKVLAEVDGKPQLNYLDLLGPDTDSIDSTDTSLAPNAYLNPSEVSNDNDDFSNFDDPDDDISISDSQDSISDNSTQDATENQSTTAQLIASGTATELAAKELLIKAGIKDRSKK